VSTSSRRHPHPHDHDHDHDHDHGHRDRRVLSYLTHTLVPHTHDAADSIDEAMEASREGVRTLAVSLVVLLVTTGLQLAVVVISSSVALLADTIHNFSDALTAIPLWIAFVLGRRAATRRYPYGLGRAEDLAGLFIVAVVAASAMVAAWQSIERLRNPAPLDNLGWVIVAGAIGFAGNEAVAIYRIRVGRRIGSAALVADGVHARTDGFTSLAVVAGAIGALLGWPLADPLVGILISAAILVLLAGTVRSIGRRLLDGIEPELTDRMEHAIGHVEGVRRIESIRLRWIGHRLHGEATVAVDEMPLSQADALGERIETAARDHLPHLDAVTVRVVARGA
jgi:cation diffusion facilitator family transporter